MKGGNLFGFLKPFWSEASTWLRKNITDPLKDWAGNAIGDIAAGLVADPKKKALAKKSAQNLANIAQNTFHNIGYKLGDALVNEGKSAFTDIDSMDAAKKRAAKMGIFEVAEDGIKQYVDALGNLGKPIPSKSAKPAKKEAKKEEKKPAQKDSKAAKLLEDLKNPPPLKSTPKKEASSSTGDFMSELQARLAPRRAQIEPTEEDSQSDIWGEGKRGGRSASRSTSRSRVSTLRKGQLPNGVYRDPDTGLFTSAKAQAKKRAAQSASFSGGRFSVLR